MTLKTWLVTGASNGLGRLLTERLLARGDRVVATVRRDGALASLKAEHGERLGVMTLDVTDTDTIRLRFAQAFALMGRIDVVVSNAGYGLFGAAEEVSDAQIDRQIATNLVGSVQVIRAALPYLRRQSGGLVVQVSSEGGQMAYPNFSVYHATKWGSLVGRRWDGTSRVIDYSAGRDPELIASYQDSVSPVALPASVWRPFYTAHKIAESYDAPAPVPALQFQGRRVVITSGLYHGRHAKGHGWAVVAAEDWNGPTYSYRSQCRAWDEGRKERGDQRGLLVRVDRQLCVLAEYVVFVDENDTSHLSTEDEASGASTTEEPAAEHVDEGGDDGDA